MSSPCILTLYVSRFTAEVTQAIESIQHICKTQLGGTCEFNVVDINEHPEEAEQHRILATPTLVRKLPLPLRRIVGDLTSVEEIIATLEFSSVDTDE